MNVTYIITFLSAFCRCAIGFVFLISFGSKVRDIAQFQHSVAAFRLLSRKVSKLASIFFLGGELAVTLCLLIGGVLLLPGFILAILLLLVFSLALGSVLARRLQISCNCFGASDQPVAIADVWRNVGLIMCALAGCGTTSWAQTRVQLLSIGEWFLAGISALLLSLLWLQLHTIVQMLSSENSSSMEP